MIIPTNSRPRLSDYQSEAFSKSLDREAGLAPSIKSEIRVRMMRLLSQTISEIKFSIFTHNVSDFYFIMQMHVNKLVVLIMLQTKHALNVVDKI